MAVVEDSGLNFSTENYTILNGQMNGQNDSSKTIFLQQNCREDWPRWVCIVGNVAGLGSTTLWFLVLLPQVWKNFRRKSVRGLSVLWATANFTASLVNLFFVFLYASIPIYGQISSVYCPVLEFLLLVQFWVYGYYRFLHKVLFLFACLLTWGAIIAVELLFDVEGTVEYVAIALWCIETFPQVILNMKLRSTSGQSFGSVFIAMVGKTTDFLCNNLLVLPLQYVIMTYFSSSVAFVNGLQVAWYYGNGLDTNLKKEAKETKEPKKLTLSRQFLLNDEPDSSWLANKLGFRRVSPKTDVARIAALCLLTGFLVACVVGFTWNIRSYYGLFAPLSIVLVLTCARAYQSWSNQDEYVVEHDTR